jgi:anti-sigma regulatory factor (Ser/Thr protein kinase)
MKEISLHILDIVRNSINAGATLVSVCITEDIRNNMLQIEITDNGKGMDADTIARVSDPFFTSGNKKTGLGIPLLRQHAEAAGGKCDIESMPDIVTRVTASFVYDHIDRQPLGDMTSTMINLIRSNPRLDFVYSHAVNGKKFELDTRSIRHELEGISLGNNEVIAFLREMITGNLRNIAN